MQHNNKAVVFILLGQSNAVGHGIPMREEDKIIKPMKMFLDYAVILTSHSRTKNLIGADILALV